MKKIYSGTSTVARHALVLGMLALVAGFVPHHAHAAGLVTCGDPDPILNPTGGPLLTNGKQACGFPEFIKMLSGIMDFLIFILAPIICVGVIVYGGFLYLTSLGSAEKRSQANGMFVKAVSGLIIAMVAWMLVKFILVELGVDTSVFPVFY